MGEQIGCAGGMEAKLTAGVGGESGGHGRAQADQQQGAEHGDGSFACGSLLGKQLK